MTSRAGKRTRVLGLAMMTTFAGGVLASSIQLPANAAPAAPATSAVTAGHCGHGHCRHDRCHHRSPPRPPRPGTLSGYQVVSEEFTPPANTLTVTRVVPCPAGKVPLGGGVQTITFSFNSRI